MDQNSAIGSAVSNSNASACLVLIINTNEPSIQSGLPPSLPGNKPKSSLFFRTTLRKISLIFSETPSGAAEGQEEAWPSLTDQVKPFILTNGTQSDDGIYPFVHKLWGRLRELSADQAVATTSYDQGTVHSALCKALYSGEQSEFPIFIMDIKNPELDFLAVRSSMDTFKKMGYCQLEEEDYGDFVTDNASCRYNQGLETLEEDPNEE